MDDWEHSREGEFFLLLSPSGQLLKAQMSLTLLMLLLFFFAFLCVDGIVVVLVSCAVCSIFLAPPLWLVFSLAAELHIWISFPDCCSLHPGCRRHSCARSLPRVSTYSSAFLCFSYKQLYVCFSLPWLQWFVRVFPWTNSFFLFFALLQFTSDNTSAAFDQPPMPFEIFLSASSAFWGLTLSPNVMDVKLDWRKVSWTITY